MSRKTKGTPNTADIHAGHQLKLRRQMLGISQAKLANALGLTFQQVQKYERGTNRISAGCLYSLSEILRVPITYFFEGYDGDTPPPFDVLPHDAAHTQETFEILSAYFSINSVEKRRATLRLIKKVVAC